MAVPMPREPESFEQAINTIIAGIIEVFNRGDVKACAGFYEQDATVLIPDQPPIKGQEAIQALLEEYVAAGIKFASIEPVEVGSSGELGYCVGIYELDTPADDGSATKETGKFVTVFRHQTDGSWKAVIDSVIRDSATG